MLCLQVLGGATDPVVTLLRTVTVCNSSASMINNGRLRVVLASSVRRLTHSDINVIVAGLGATTHDDAVDVTSCAAIDLVFLRCVTRVPWQVLLFISNLMRHLGVRKNDCYNLIIISNFLYAQRLTGFLWRIFWDLVWG